MRVTIPTGYRFTPSQAEGDLTTQAAAELQHQEVILTEGSSLEALQQTLQGSVSNGLLSRNWAKLIRTLWVKVHESSGADPNEGSRGFPQCQGIMRKALAL